jgi:hypothetical protein
LPCPHARVAGSSGGRRKPLTAHRDHASDTVIARGTGGVVACPDEVREPGKSGLAHQAKGFCPAWTTHPNLCIIQRGIEAMRIKYPKAIKEKEEELRRLEQRLRGQKSADRVRMLRLLKSEVVKSLKDCAPLVGYSVAQSVDSVVEALSETGPGQLAAAPPAGASLTLDSRSVGRLDASDASGTDCDSARRA